MSKFQNYLKTFDITSTLTEEDIDKTLALLQIYGPAVRRTASRIGEMEEECYEGRRQSISDFINLAIDYDRDTDRKRIADRLAEMGHSMQLLSVMEDALVLVKDTPPNGGTYFNILQARYSLTGRTAVSKTARGCSSRPIPANILGCRQMVKAPVSDTGICWFKSSHPSHIWRVNPEGPGTAR